MKTIFLAEGERHVREALKLMLGTHSNFEIVGEAGTAESALAKVCPNPPNVILLDWNLPGLHPQRMLAALRQSCPETLVLATSVKPEQESIAMQFDADAFLLKQLPPDQFISMLIAAVNQKERTG